MRFAQDHFSFQSQITHCLAPIIEHCFSRIAARSFVCKFGTGFVQKAFVSCFRFAFTLPTTAYFMPCSLSERVILPLLIAEDCLVRWNSFAVRFLVVGLRIFVWH